MDMVKLYDSSPDARSSIVKFRSSNANSVIGLMELNGIASKRLNQ